MNDAPDHTNLATALAAFQAEMPTVGKGKTATVPTKTGGSYRYTYADLADVTQAAMPLLSKHGLSFICRPRRCENGDYELVGVLRHTTGSDEEGSLPLVGRGAQEIGASLTYNRRYLLGCMTGIVTDDDEDANVVVSTQRTRHDPPPPDPMNAAKARVKGAWEARSAWDPAAMRADYEEWSAMPIADATPEDLERYVAHLTEEGPA